MISVAYAGFIIWTPDGVCTYAENIRSTPGEKLILRMCAPLPSCQPSKTHSRSTSRDFHEFNSWV